MTKSGHQCIFFLIYGAFENRRQVGRDKLRIDQQLLPGQRVLDNPDDLAM
jgi:hypothetical protein